MTRVVLVVCCGLLFSACAAKEDTVVLMKSLNAASGKAIVHGALESKVLTVPGDTVDIAGDTMTTRTSAAAEVATAFGAVFPPPPSARVYQILFDTGEQALPLEADAIIAALLADVAANPPAEVQITGHTDSVGSLESNDRLSKTRAVAVREALIIRGLKASLIRTVGRGEREPLVDTVDEVVELRNRRVEIVVR